MTTTPVASGVEREIPAQPSASPPPVRRRRSARVREQAVAYALLAPAVVVLAGLLAYPAVRVLLISFQELNRREIVLHQTKWVGLQNYRSVFTGAKIWTVTGRTVVFTGILVATTVFVGLGVALLLQRLSRPTRIALQAALVAAWAMPIISATTVFQWLFDENYGIVDKTLAGIGFSSWRHHPWFFTGHSGLFVIGLLIVWQAVPFVAFSVYAGILGIDRDLYEAAGLDGAGAVRSFRSITWPMLKPLVLLLTFLSLIWDFRAFTQIYAFRRGGPAGSTTTLSVLQYVTGISQAHYGKAAVVSVFMIAVLVLLSAQYLRLLLKSEKTA
ncbi:carbohydrate ABC transporter membrane protein 1 (CUT1 family) [Motilibacter rhizosphaerae]|uniref:Carbohydrate ABC transporter membrane protein 1 (CUT1 family) n=1 Tax=Motilibacter rhizosphaerae TaxID=598652 RepID=A0A4Q7NGA3_9ACTN|nr:sugar ABC transporter permease [Motilibacter rhizosphaerae]RZS82839.1 carbohydrate ABC transporter membrane protein 1 (CUT1 family) [Motilibacter rhizosphaerae]